ncbi:MAG: acyl-CoA dehydrogenase family protein [Chloroflexi bacterium]|nr:acyl-CoA dehydrogenase family protein [Chloroflexota bacterium]
MEFQFTPEQQDFRREVKDFLKQNPPETFPLQNEDSGFGFGGWSREFSRKLGEKGWIALTWPKEYGGLARPLMHKLVLLEEMAYHHAPFFAHFLAESTAHIIIERGSKTLKEETLSSIAKGETSFWLAFSEPDAGTDLLNISSTAVEDGDYFVLNGQKIWSSNSHLAHYGYLLARTDQNVPRHKGVSMFIVPKRLPGISVTGLINLAGFRWHNQVFFDNVRVPRDYLIGEKNQGFYYLLKGLEYDRFWGRFVKAPYCQRILEQLIQYVRDASHQSNAHAHSVLIRHRLAEMAIEVEACRLLFYSIGWAMSKGRELSYESSGAKVFADEMGLRLADVGMQVLGLYGQLEPDSKHTALKGKIERLYLTGRGHTIAGGTSEVVRNTVAMRGLGMPR